MRRDENLNPKLMGELFPYGEPILLGYRGSVSHGTFVPSNDPNSIDDIDLLGVFLAPINFYIGLNTNRRYFKAVERFIGKFDAVSYELRKAIHLLMNCNPNVMSLLWLNPEHYLTKKEEGAKLIEIRDAFISRRAYNSYTGYATSQFKKMTKFERKGYMGEKRKALVRKFGFDTKNASHLIRLLTMGIEILQEGIVKPFRKDDAQLFVDIKQGKWSLEQIQREAKRLYKKADEAFAKTTISQHPDVDRIEKVVVDILGHHLKFNQ